MKGNSNKAGMPMISYGVDESVIKTPTQPNYVALPFVAANVECSLPAEFRQRLVKKAADSVVLADAG